jgi:hypothetical protein
MPADLLTGEEGVLAAAANKHDVAVNKHNIRLMNE